MDAGPFGVGSVTIKSLPTTVLKVTLLSLSLSILILPNLSLVSYRCLASPAPPRPLGRLPEPLCLLSLCLSLSHCVLSICGGGCVSRSFPV